MIKLDDPDRPLLPHDEPFSGFYKLKERKGCVIYVGKNSTVRIDSQDGLLAVSVRIDGEYRSTTQYRVPDHDQG